MLDRISDIKYRIAQYFFRLRIAHKMLLAYLPLALLLVLISSLTLSSLDKMSTINLRVL